MRRAPVPALFLLVAATAGERAARAAAPECASMTVAADTSTTALWPDLKGQIESRFAAEPAVDSCASVRLERLPNAIAVEVALTDGRVASRSVARAEDVIPVLEALLLVPEGSPSESTGSGSAPGPAESASAAADGAPPNATARPPQEDTANAPPGFVPEEAEPRRGRSKVAIELGALGDVRGGDLPTTLGVGLRSTLELWGWLVGADVRVRNGSGEPTYELAGVLGHRFAIRSLELDVFGGPLAELAAPVTSSSGPAHLAAAPRPDGEPWFTFGSHLRFTPRDTLSAFVGAEGTFGVVGTEDPSPQWTTDDNLWMGAVVLGATVGTR